MKNNKVSKFFEFHSSSDSNILDWIKLNYDKSKVDKMIESESYKSGLINREDMEEQGIEDEYDYYCQFGSTQLDDFVAKKILNDSLKASGIEGSEPNTGELVENIKKYFEIS